MAALPAAQAAMDAHRGVVAVAEQGLAFLRKLSVAEANQVIRLHLLVLLFACMHVQCALRSCVVVYRYR